MVDPVGVQVDPLLAVRGEGGVGAGGCAHFCAAAQLHRHGELFCTRELSARQALEPRQQIGLALCRGRVQRSGVSGEEPRQLLLAGRGCPVAQHLRAQVLSLLPQGFTGASQQWVRLEMRSQQG